MSKPSAQSVLLVSALSPAALWVAYIWGLIFYQTSLDAWGFDADDFPISVQDTYVQSFIAVMAVITRPMLWLNQANHWSWLIALMVVIMLASAVAAKVSTLTSVKQFWRRAKFWHLSTTGANSSMVFRRTISLCATVALVIAGIPAVLGGLCFAGYLIISPPLLAARALEQEVWDQGAYKNWPQITWIDDMGKLNIGYLRVHSVRSYGVFQSGRAMIIPASQIKHIDKAVPLTLSGHK